MLRNQVKNPAASGNAVLMLRGFFLRKKPGVESMTVHICWPFIPTASCGASWLFPVNVGWLTFHNKIVIIGAASRWRSAGRETYWKEGGCAREEAHHGRRLAG